MVHTYRCSAYKKPKAPGRSEDPATTPGEEVTIRTRLNITTAYPRYRELIRTSPKALIPAIIRHDHHYRHLHIQISTAAQSPDHRFTQLCIVHRFYCLSPSFLHILLIINLHRATQAPHLY